MAYYAQKDSCGDIYVITTAKKRDSLEWQKDAAKFGIGTRKEATIHGVLTIDSWNNIAKYEGLKGHTFIFDEQRLVGNGAWVKSFYKIAKNNSWILLSATPGDTWMDYAPVFIANGFYSNITEFKRKHVIYSPFTKYPKIDRFVGVKELQKNKETVLIEMPYKKKTTRTLNYVDVYYDEDLFKLAYKDRWNPFTDQPIKDASELFSVLRKVVNSDRSRLDALRRIMEDHPRVIVFYNYNYELELLRELNDTWSDLFQIAEWNGQKKEPIPDSENWVYLVQYQAGAEGWNCTSTDTMVFYSLTYSYRRFEQAQGRIDRINNLYNLLSYYVLVSDSIVDRAVKTSLKTKKTFNENAWLKSNNIIFD